MLSKESKIYVAGHRGLVGSAIWNNLLSRGYTNLVGRTHSELDLTDQQAVRRFFDAERPDAVVLAAAHVGGIMANSLYRADFIMRNMQIQCNVISEAYAHGVQKLLFLGSTCIYPKMAPQPLREDSLLTLPLEYSNEPYAIAKIAGLKMCESYNLQYGTNYIAVMPTNLYGPGDNFHLQNAHVMPSIMRKIYLSHLLRNNNWDAIRTDLRKRPVDHVTAEDKENDIAAALASYGISSERVDLWGSGTPLREFLWSEDMADASVYLLLNVDFSDIIHTSQYMTVVDGKPVQPTKEIRNCHINIGTGKEITIRQLAEKVARAVGYEGEVVFDATKPDGTPRKLTDVSKLHALGWKHKIDIDEGVEKLYQWYRQSLKA